MERIVLEVSEAAARRWNALPHKERKEFTRQFEERFLQLHEDGDSATEFPQKMNEPAATYGTTAKKVRKVLKTSERKPTAKDIRAFYTAFQVDMSDYTFNRDEANER